jgi:hypothetical protein
VIAVVFPVFFVLSRLTNILASNKAELTCFMDNADVLNFM